MALEIERKFLPGNDRWRRHVERSVRMRQGYLGGDGVSIRVRLADNSALINIKENRLGEIREEFEYPVPLDDGLRLMELARRGGIDKTRHYVRHVGHLWEIDEFHGANTGLVVAEIELGDPREEFERPDWLGVEVTGDERYYNVSLALHPWRDWGAV